MSVSVRLIPEFRDHQSFAAHATRVQNQGSNLSNSANNYTYLVNALYVRMCFR